MEGEFQKPIFRTQKFGDAQRMISRLTKRGLDAEEQMVETTFFVRYGSECTEIILGDTIYTFTRTVNFPRSHLYLFQMVRNNALKWLENKSDVVLPPERKSSFININYDDSEGKLVGTDLNHAFWRIAFIKGIINEKTYEKGLNENVKVKALRLATLSVLGREKKFTEYVNGKPVGDHVTQKKDEKKKKVFLYVRLVCYNMMFELSKKLGADFERWKTDCIYYRDTPENRAIVENFFASRQMQYKHLDYFPEENEEKEPNDFNLQK